MGRELALGLEPQSELDAIRSALLETREGRHALAAAGTPPWESIPDIRDLLERARVPGSVAEGGELVTLLPLLDAAGRLCGYGRGIAAEAPGLSKTLAGLPRITPLRDLLRRSLDVDGAVVDDASPALRRLRQRGRELRRVLVKRLEQYFHGAAAEPSSRSATSRSGTAATCCLRAEAKSRFKGIVHDRSQSGATLFIEPEGVVEDNNDLVQAAREEEAEVLRVLAALTRAVGDALPELEALVHDVGRLDLAFARAEFAEAMEATEPAVSEERVADVMGARNPLLLAQAWQAPERPVVPMDLRVGGDRPLP
jgi:DNA mismatch repair protein MutS2